jgi:predicted transcriptional regulator
LQNHSEGVDDDELAQFLGLSARQRANMQCRALEQEGLAIRRRVSGKIRNFWTGYSHIIASSMPHAQKSDQSSVSKSEH